MKASLYEDTSLQGESQEAPVLGEGFPPIPSQAVQEGQLGALGQGLCGHLTLRRRGRSSGLLPASSSSSSSPRKRLVGRIPLAYFLVTSTKSSRAM